MTRVTLWVDALEPQPGGIGRYTWELCKRLPAAGVDPRFFARGRLIDDPGALLRGDPLPPPPGKLRSWWDKRRLSASLVHGPNYFLPPFADSGIITVHDLSVFRFPETHPAARVAAFEREFLRSLGRATHVITDTETVREEVIAAFGVAREAITAIPLGVDPGFRPMAAGALAPVLAKWGLEANRYGLCVSTIEPRKKISELLAAWRRLPTALRNSCPLVLCGGAGWRNAQLRSEIESAEAEGWLRYLGFIEDGLLPQLYAGAALFVYPSVYEGFGLPPVEAMASGVPVIVSRRSCLPEVCGDAAGYIDPDDADGFVRAIEHGLTDPQWRAQSTKRGLERAAQLNWEACIDRTANVYRHVASSR